MATTTPTMPTPIPPSETPPAAGRTLTLYERVEQQPWNDRFPEPASVEAARDALERCNRDAGGHLMALIASTQAILHKPERGHLTPDRRSVPDEAVLKFQQRQRSLVRVSLARARVLRRWIAARTGGEEADALAVAPPTQADELLCEVVDALAAARRGDATADTRKRSAAVLRRAVEHVRAYRKLLATHAEAWDAQRERAHREGDPAL